MLDAQQQLIGELRLEAGIDPVRLQETAGERIDVGREAAARTAAIDEVTAVDPAVAVHVDEVAAAEVARTVEGAVEVGVPRRRQRVELFRRGVAELIREPRVARPEESLALGSDGI